MEQPDEHVVVCFDEESAQAEAQRRNETDPDQEAFMWTWMRLDGQWVAKRYPRDDKPVRNDGGLIGSIIDVLLP